MDLVLVIDTETTGLSPATDTCIEVAAVLYSLRFAGIVKVYSTLLAAGVENAAESVNHIPSGALELGATPSNAWKTVDGWGKQAEAVLAHNADFDRSFVPAEVLSSIPWIDTCDGITWPRQSKPGASLISLALDHGLGVVDPHRALNDCLLLARLLTRCAELGHDVGALLAQGLRPRAMFQALVSFDDKDKAKEAGFRWDAPTRRWLRKMAVEDAGKLGFRVQEVQA